MLCLYNDKALVVLPSHATKYLLRRAEEKAFSYAEYFTSKILTCCYLQIYKNNPYLCNGIPRVSLSSDKPRGLVFSQAVGYSV